MKIKWLEDCELEVITNFHEDTEEAETEMDVFRKDEVSDVDALAYYKDEPSTAGFQFGNGDCAYGVPCSLFEVIEGQDELEEMA